MNESSQFIVYACPTGELNSQITTYLTRSRTLYGANKAHKYMPHCTLTGFFTDELSSIPDYLQALDQAYLAATNNLSLNIKIKQLNFSNNWHGLELQAEEIKQLIANFAKLATSSTRPEALRLKDWLHLSLAYGFEAKDEQNLTDLARKIINPQAKVNWELRFYQKNPDWTWKCWQTWQID